MGVETGSHIPLGIGCTFPNAIAVPFPATGAHLPVMVVKRFLAMRSCVKLTDSSCRQS